MTTEITKPRLYLDIDGVILAETSEFTDTGEDSWGVYSREVAQRLGSLSVERVWLTTWREEQIFRLERLLGMPGQGRVLAQGEEFDFADEQLNDLNAHIAWKYQALIEDQEHSPSPFIWAEDRLTRSVINAAHQRFVDRPHLFVIPKNLTGLRERDVQAVENFCQQLL